MLYPGRREGSRAPGARSQETGVRRQWKTKRREPEGRQHAAALLSGSRPLAPELRAGHGGFGGRGTTGWRPGRREGDAEGAADARFALDGDRPVDPGDVLLDD